MVNEFEENKLGTDSEEIIEEDDNDNMIASSSKGSVYNYDTAPDYAKAPPRINMNGMTVVIKKAEIRLPPLETPWLKTRDGQKDVKYPTFAIVYDHAGQTEFFSGVRIFKKDNKYSHPTITKDRVNQASDLLGKYADFKKKDINEVSLKEFMSYLNSSPKVLIKTIQTKNPQTGKLVDKNMIDKFL